MIRILALISILFSFTSKHSWGEETIAPDSKYLKTLPPITEETKQWFIPSQNGSWGGWYTYTLKEFVVIPYEDSKQKKRYEIKLFEKADLSGEKVLILDADKKYQEKEVMVLPDGKVCMYQPYRMEVTTESWIECVNNKCELLSSQMPVKKELRDGKNFKWYEYSKDKTSASWKLCFEANGGVEFAKGKNRSYAFIPEEVNLDKRIAKVKIGNKDYFLNLSTCFLKDSDICNIHFGKTKKELSEFERDWILSHEDFEKVQVNLNKFFDKISKHGTTVNDVTDAQESNLEMENPNLSFEKKPKSLTEDFVNEAKECALRRKLAGKRGPQYFFRGKKKICSIRHLAANPDVFAIQWIDYPEAFMYRLRSVIRLP